MWQKSGSSTYFSYKDAEAYIKRLNQEKSDGYSDWRLPTLPELTSLLEPEKKNGFYIAPVFDSKSRWYWSSDLRSGGGAWLVGFGYGGVHWSQVGDLYVRLVRLGQ